MAKANSSNTPNACTTDSETRKREADFVAMVLGMPRDKQDVMIYLGRLYLVRQQSQSDETTMEIERIEGSIRDERVPVVPRPQ